MKNKFGTKKMLGNKDTHTRATIKTSNSAIKTDLVCGFVQKQKIRCGKANCKCSRGEHHTAYYHVWYTDRKRYRKFIRKSNLENIRQACQNHRELQARIRAGRAEYKQLIARARLLLRIGLL